MAVEIREATPQEAEDLGFTQPDGYDTWTTLIIEDGEIRGHLRLSRALGQVFGHDTKVWTEDRTAALRLWRTAVRKAKEWGADAVVVHIEDGDPIKEFWTRQGFKPMFTIYRGEI